MSQKDDEFYCGSEESEKESINPFRVIREAEDRPRNALQEAIDRALRTPDYACGTEQNPHIVEPRINYEDDFNRAVNDMLFNRRFRCVKCNQEVLLKRREIQSIKVALVTLSNSLTPKPIYRRNSDGRECDE